MDRKTKALKLALEALSKSDDFLFDWHENESDNEADAYATARQLNVQAITAIEEALAQPEIEYQERILRLEGALKKALAQPEQNVDDGYCKACDGWKCTAKAGCVAISNPPPPPQRTWVGLTDEEIMDVAFNFDVPSISLRTIEAKLKEKNT